PVHSDEKTELQPGLKAAPAGSSTQTDASREEPTELAPAAPPSPTGEDKTVIQNVPRGDRPAPHTERPATVTPDKTEVAPGSLPPLPLPEPDSTEFERLPGTSGAPTAPTRVRGYKLIQPLGAGTYGQVWLAEEERTGIRVAIKFLAHGTDLEW